MAKIETVRKKRLRIHFATWYIRVSVIIILLIVSFSAIVWRNPNNLDLIESFISFMTLIFAMFIGYFAFDEFRASKREEYRKAAEKALIAFNFEEAIQNYESAYNLGAKDFDTLSNLSELQSIFGKPEKAVKLAEEAMESVTDYRYKVVVSYLKILAYIVSKDTAKLKKEIKSLIELSEKHPAMDIRWRFDDVKKKLLPEFDQRSKKNIWNSKRFSRRKIPAQRI